MSRISVAHGWKQEHKNKVNADLQLVTTVKQKKMFLPSKMSIVRCYILITNGREVQFASNSLCTVTKWFPELAENQCMCHRSVLQTQLRSQSVTHHHQVSEREQHCYVWLCCCVFPIQISDPHCHCQLWTRQGVCKLACELHHLVMWLDPVWACSSAFGTN